MFHKQHLAHILAVIQLQIEGPNAQVFFRCVTKMEPIEVRQATAIGGNDFTIDDGERHGDRSEYLGRPEAFLRPRVPARVDEDGFVIVVLSQSTSSRSGTRAWAVPRAAAAVGLMEHWS